MRLSDADTFKLREIQVNQEVSALSGCRVNDEFNA